MKPIKRVLAIVLALSLCLALSGCKALDEARANQAFWQDDDTVVCGDKTYHKLDIYQDVFTGSTTSCHITKTDVPVLLASIFGDYAERNDRLLCVRGAYYFEEAYLDLYSRDVVLDHIGVIDYVPSPEDRYRYQPVLSLLSDERAAALNDVSEAVEEPRDAYHVEELLACDANGLFTAPLFRLLCDSDGRYYRIDDTTGDVFTYTAEAEAVIAKWRAECDAQLHYDAAFFEESEFVFAGD